MLFSADKSGYQTFIKSVLVVNIMLMNISNLQTVINLLSAEIKRDCNVTSLKYCIQGVLQMNTSAEILHKVLEKETL